MHTVELLQLAVEAAESLGYRIRHEYLGGSGGGACEFGGRKWLFIDLASNSMEQLDQVLAALRDDPGIYLVDLPAPLSQLLGVRRSA